MFIKNVVAKINLFWAGVLYRNNILPVIDSSCTTWWDKFYFRLELYSNNIAEYDLL